MRIGVVKMRLDRRISVYGMGNSAGNLPGPFQEVQVGAYVTFSATVLSAICHLLALYAHGFVSCLFARVFDVVGGDLASH